MLELRYLLPFTIITTSISGPNHFTVLLCTSDAIAYMIAKHSVTAQHAQSLRVSGSRAVLSVSEPLQARFMHVYCHSVLFDLINYTPIGPQLRHHTWFPKHQVIANTAHMCDAAQNGHCRYTAYIW